MKTITVQELHEKMRISEAMQGSIVIDVRTPEEYAQGHIPTAVNKPLDKLALYEDALKMYDKVYVHCRTGGRSSRACERLAQIGHEEVYNILGGVEAWQQAGYNVEV